MGTGKGRGHCSDSSPNSASRHPCPCLLRFCLAAVTWAAWHPAPVLQRVPFFEVSSWPQKCLKQLQAKPRARHCSERASQRPCRALALDAFRQAGTRAPAPALFCQVGGADRTGGHEGSGKSASCPSALHTGSLSSLREERIGGIRPGLSSPHSHACVSGTPEATPGLDALSLLARTLSSSSTLMLQGHASPGAPPSPRQPHRCVPSTEGRQLVSSHLLIPCPSWGHHLGLPLRGQQSRHVCHLPPQRHVSNTPGHKQSSDDSSRALLCRKRAVLHLLGECLPGT